MHPYKPLKVADERVRISVSFRNGWVKFLLSAKRESTSGPEEATSVKHSMYGYYSSQSASRHYGVPRRKQIEMLAATIHLTSGFPFMSL